MKTAFANFRVYPDKKRYFYFRVLVFRNRADMYEFAGDHATGKHKSAGSRNYDAITMPWERRRPGRNGKLGKLGRHLGTILFFRNRTGTGCVSHEMTHAACHYFRIMKGSVIVAHPAEELLAGTVGELTKQFYKRY